MVRAIGGPDPSRVLLSVSDATEDTRITFEISNESAVNFLAANVRLTGRLVQRQPADSRSPKFTSALEKSLSFIPPLKTSE